MSATLVPQLTNAGKRTDISQVKHANTLAKISQLTSSATKWCFKKSSDMLVGAAIWGGIQCVLTGGYSFQIVKAALTNHDDFYTNKYVLKGVFENFVSIAKTQGFDVTKVSPESIIDSHCPAEEYRNQVNLLYKTNYTRSDEIKMQLIGMVAAPAVGEELLFRGVLQDAVLKRLAGKIIRKISPNHSSIVDSKIYTAIRILITSFAFSAWHELNRGVLTDEYVDMQRYSTFIMGIAFGILKETRGLAASIGGHAINNLVAVIPAICAKC